MALQFSIIPVTSDFLSTAHDIQTKLKDNIKLGITINIDTNYTLSLTTRINKWKKLSYNVIIIDQDYNESNSIVIIFSHKGSKGEVMEVKEFIELVSSFEDDDQYKNTDKTNTTDTKIYDDTQDGGCIIM